MFFFFELTSNTKTRVSFTTIVSRAFNLLIQYKTFCSTSGRFILLTHFHVRMWYECISWTRHLDKRYPEQTSTQLFTRTLLRTLLCQNFSFFTGFVCVTLFRYFLIKFSNVKSLVRLFIYFLL